MTTMGNTSKHTNADRYHSRTNSLISHSALFFEAVCAGVFFCRCVFFACPLPYSLEQLTTMLNSALSKYGAQTTSNTTSRSQYTCTLSSSAEDSSGDAVGGDSVADLRLPLDVVVGGFGLGDWNGACGHANNQNACAKAGTKSTPAQT